MAQVVWTEPALNEMDEIAEYIAINNFQAAQRFIQAIFKRVDQLKNHSKSGREVPELPKNSIYREVVVEPCRVFYRIEGTKIIIIYVMRSERVLRNFILKDRATLSS